jgi:hypothetical protein
MVPRDKSLQILNSHCALGQSRRRIAGTSGGSTLKAGQALPSRQHHRLSANKSPLTSLSRRRAMIRYPATARRRQVDHHLEHQRVRRDVPKPPALDTEFKRGWRAIDLANARLTSIRRPQAMRPRIGLRAAGLLSHFDRREDDLSVSRRDGLRCQRTCSTRIKAGRHKRRWHI